MRGKVTEIFGPSGVGKTSFGIQAVVSALREGQRVVWVDAACAPLFRQRFQSVLGGYHNPPSTPSNEPIRRLQYFTAPTLAHLLALFMQPPGSFPLQNTSLVVVDSLATLVDNAYPRNQHERNTHVKTEHARWAAGRRFAIINELISTLTRFAATHDIALLVTSQTITRIRSASRAILVPAMSGVEWENGVSTRLVLFRDWMSGEGTYDKLNATRLRRARFVGLNKANGVTLAKEGGVGNVVAFTIEHSGLQDLDLPANEITTPTVLSTQVRPSKRSFAEIDQDSGEDAVAEPNSDELYGWIEDDEVAAEGLLVEDTPIADKLETTSTRLEVVVTEERGKKAARTTTI